MPIIHCQSEECAAQGGDDGDQWGRFTASSTGRRRKIQPLKARPVDGAVDKGPAASPNIHPHRSAKHLQDPSPEGVRSSNMGLVGSAGLEPATSCL